MSWTGEQGKAGLPGCPEGVFFPENEWLYKPSVIIEIDRIIARINIADEQDIIMWGIVSGQFIPLDEREYE